MIHGPVSATMNKSSSPLCIGPERFRRPCLHVMPACTVGEPGYRAAFQSCLAAAVHGPERFLGRICSYGA